MRFHNLKKLTFRLFEPFREFWSRSAWLYQFNPWNGRNPSSFLAYQVASLTYYSNGSGTSNLRWRGRDCVSIPLAATALWQLSQESLTAMKAPPSTSERRKGARIRWLNRTVLGIGLTSLFSNWSHEIATTLVPAFLASMGVAAA